MDDVPLKIRAADEIFDLLVRGIILSLFFLTCIHYYYYLIQRSTMAFLKIL